MDAFYWLKSDRSTFQIFCSRSLGQNRINYKFHVSVRLLTIKISQWAREDSAVIVKINIDNIWLPFIDVDECKNNAGMKNYSVCVNGECQNTMNDYMCVCHAGFRSDVTKKLCNGKTFKLICCLIILDVFFYSCGISRIHSPRTFWSAGVRPERLCDNERHFPRTRRVPFLVRMLELERKWEIVWRQWVGAYNCTIFMSRRFHRPIYF